MASSLEEIAETAYWPAHFAARETWR